MDCPFSPLPEAHIAHLRSKVGAFLPAYPCLSLPVPSSQEQLQPQSVARELRLDQRNAELLVKKLDSFDLLVLLVVVSHTHFLTKARGGLKMQCHANKIKQDETRVKNSMSLKMCLGPRWFTKLCSFCGARLITKGSLGYLSSMYFSTSLVLGEVDVPFPEIETRESRTET